MTHQLSFSFVYDPSLMWLTNPSTGIALALLAKSRGYEVELYLPDNVSDEKVDLLTALGAQIKVSGFLFLLALLVDDPNNM